MVEQLIGKSLYSLQVHPINRSSLKRKGRLLQTTAL